MAIMTNTQGYLILSVLWLIAAGVSPNMYYPKVVIGLGFACFASYEAIRNRKK